MDRPYRPSAQGGPLDQGAPRRSEVYGAAVRVTGFDHIVLLSSDIERSLAFYCDQLGMAPERVEEWRRGEVFFPSIRVGDGTVIDVFPGDIDGKNVDHYCLVVEPTDLHAVADRDDLDVQEGPVPRWGARGMGWSVYLRDPDGHVVELRHYGADPAGGAA
jgi:catechol 2,3-dioxygenase-like lactoylglutathione lyase family enzyme